MNTLAKVGEGSVAAMVVTAIGVYVAQNPNDIRSVYVLGAIAGVWIVRTTVIQAIKIWKCAE